MGTGTAAASERRDGRRNAPSPRPARSLVHLAQYAGFRGASFALGLLPLSLLYRAASLLGRLAYHVDRGHRRVARKNLDLAYGDALSPAEKRAITAQAFRNMVLVAFDVVTIGRRLRPDNVRRYGELQGLDLADRARGERGCAIYVTAHFGSWEAVFAALGVVGHSFHGVARPMPNAYIDRYLRRARERLGQHVVSKYGVVSELIRLLRRGESLGFVADQDARRHGIFVEFFGQPASSVTTPALLAYKFGVPIIVGHAERIDWSFRFRATVDRVLVPDTTRPRDEEVRRLTQEVASTVEAFVRGCPGQYLWLHRRFKTRPPGHEKVYR